MDEAAIRKNCREYLAAFRGRYPSVEVSFAGKAFLCKGICKIVEQEGLCLDVASGGELFTALQAGFPAERISLHGNNKSVEELRMALDARIGHLIIDNFNEIDLLTELARDLAEPQSVLLRVAPGIDPHTHQRISTGQVDTKFGFDIGSGAALTAISRVREIPGLRLRGLHCHVGSQLHDTECHEASVAIMVDLLAEAKRAFGVEFDELNVGGGLGIRYLSSHCPPSLDEFAEVVATEELLRAFYFPPAPEARRRGTAKRWRGRAASQPATTAGHVAETAAKMTFQPPVAPPRGVPPRSPSELPVRRLVRSWSSDESAVRRQRQ